MIHVYRSNRLNKHANLLADMPAIGGHADPFFSPVIIVPNLDTSRWLQLELAGSNGFAGNLSFMLPAEWQWNQIRKLWPDTPKLLSSDPEPMTWALFRLLSNQDYLSRFELLEGYVQSRPSETRESAIFELAGILSSLFDQYQIYRPAMLVEWQEGRIGKRKDEQWQARIWKDFNDRHVKQESGRTKMNRAELVQKTINALKGGQIKAETELFVFNPGLIPKPIVEMLELWGRTADVHLFLMQPAGTLRAANNDSHPLISSLGDEADALVILWNFSPEKTQTAEQESYYMPKAESLLQQVQASIAKNDSSLAEPGSASGERNGTETVRVVSCHSRLREIEALFDFIMERLDKDDTLHPEEILVVMPDLEPYRSAIHAIFGQSEPGLPNIPYHLSGSLSSEESELRRATQQLLNLPESRFEFRTVMDIFLMKPVYEKFGLSQEEATRARQWMEENHVHWGLDEEHRREWDQPGSSRHHTWKAAMRRGWLGQLMAPEPGEIFRDALLYPGVQTTTDKEIWAAFSFFLHKLDEFRKKAQKGRTPSEWAEFFDNTLSDFISDDRMESLQSHFLAKSLRDFRETATVAGMDQAVGCGLASKWLQKQITSPGAAGALFNRGVTFTTMVPVRSIPFRVIAMIGLNEGVFPRKMSSPDFDLMMQDPDPTDRNRRNEDRNLFLESVMAAEEVHYCSYIGRSQTDNESVPPSPVVSEWIGFLARFTGLDEKELIVQAPLTGYSPSAYSETYRSWSETGLKTAKALAGGGKTLNGLYRPKTQFTLPDSADEHIELQKLIRYVQNPIRGFLSERFDSRLYGYDEEKQEFEINGLERHILFDRIFGWKLHGRDGFNMESVLLGSGILPAGRPGRMELNSLLDSVDEALAVIREEGFEPSLMHHHVDLLCHGQHIIGELQSYSEHLHLELRISKKTAGALIRGWITHLILNAMEPENPSESVLICDLKNDPVKITYTRVENPEELLKPYLDLFTDLQNGPVPFYPETVLAYVEHQKKGEDTALDKAQKAFEGTGYRYSRAERDDLYSTVMMGADAGFSKELLNDRYCELVREMLNHLREEKCSV